MIHMPSEQDDTAPYCGQLLSPEDSVRNVTFGLMKDGNLSICPECTATLRQKMLDVASASPITAIRPALGNFASRGTAGEVQRQMSRSLRAFPEPYHAPPLSHPGYELPLYAKDVVTMTAITPHRPLGIALVPNDELWNFLGNEKHRRDRNVFDSHLLNQMQIRNWDEYRLENTRSIVEMPPMPATPYKLGMYHVYVWDPKTGCQFQAGQDYQISIRYSLAAELQPIKEVARHPLLCALIGSAITIVATAAIQCE